MKIGRRLRRLLTRRETDRDEEQRRRVAKAHLPENVRRERARAESKVFTT